MSTEVGGNKKYKCRHCESGRAAIPRSVSALGGEVLEIYLHCPKCGASSADFVPAEAADAPEGCNLSSIFAQGCMG
jgi:rubredoxin